MKGTKGLLILTVALAVLLTMLAAPALAGTTWTEFTGTSSPAGRPMVDYREWVSDGIVHVRGMEGPYYNAYSDPRIAGFDRVTTNFNLHLRLPEAYGPMWGTAHISEDPGYEGPDYWEGTWVGYRTMEGFSYLKEVLHGHGAYEGLQARLDLAREDPNPAAPFMVQGVIMDPGGKWE